MSDSSDKQCPGCLGHSRQEQLEAVGMVLTAAEAMVWGSDDEIVMTAKELTPLEAHKAVTLYAGLVLQISALTGLNPKAYFGQIRKGVNEALAKTA